MTVKVTPLLGCPATVATTGPVVAPAGTEVRIAAALQLLGIAGVPLNVMVLVPWVAPKVAPLTVTAVPTEPEFGVRLVMLGVTVKGAPLLVCPLTVMTTVPVVAPEGTGTAILVALQLLGVAVIPLNLIVLVPCVAPKLVPATVMGVPTAPMFGVRPPIDGAAVGSGTVISES